MKPTSAHGDDELSNVAVDHEHSDINVRAILGFGGIVAAVTIVCALIVWGVFDLFERMAVARDPKLSPLALPAKPMPERTAASPYFGSGPEPHLVTSEPAVLRILRQSEQKQLHEYGWIDEKAGVAHLPIDQAKKLIAERGLPSRAAGVDARLGTHAPAFGEATGGRSIPTRDMPAAGAQAPPADQPTAPTPAKEGIVHSSAGGRGA